jgi:hypothetical protein
MPLATSNRAKRLAASHVCLGLFAVLHAVAHTLSRVASTDDLWDGMGAGLTPKERAYVERQVAELKEKAELFRKLGHRFAGRRS